MQVTTENSVLTDANFQKEVLESTQPVLVEFRCDWCGTCHIMAPIIEELMADYHGQLKVGTLDVDDNQRVVQEYGVRVLPTFLFFRNGQVVDHIFGAVPKKVITGKINRLRESNHDRQ